MGFVDKVKTKLDTVKTTLFGDLNDGQAHGFRAGFVPTLAPSLVAAGAIALGAPAAVVAGAAVALMAAKEAEKKGYNFKRLLTGGGAGCALGAVLVFNVAAAYLPPEQPKAPAAEPVPSTLEIKPSGGGLCKNFNVAETTDAAGKLVYILTVPKGCTVPAAAAAVPR